MILGQLEEIYAAVLEQITANSLKVAGALLILVAGWLGIQVLNRGMKKAFKKARLDKTVADFIRKTSRMFLWLIVFALVLANFGIDVTGLVAGLGIAGVIVGFALQDTLSNLAAGVFILYYKPFKTGDWINVNGIVGGVKEIGIAACTLNTPDNTKVVIPNSKVWGNPILNYNGNKTRCIRNIKIGISYSDDIGKAIRIINSLLEKDARVLKDPAAQVVVTELGESSVNIEVRPWVEGKDFWDVYFYLIRNIKEEFDKNKITIPFPQRDVHMKKK